MVVVIVDVVTFVPKVLFTLGVLGELVLSDSTTYSGAMYQLSPTESSLVGDAQGEIVFDLLW